MDRGTRGGLRDKEGTRLPTAPTHPPPWVTLPRGPEGQEGPSSSGTAESLLFAPRQVPRANGLCPRPCLRTAAPSSSVGSEGMRTPPWA